jgi:hypothetical protein
MEDASRVLQEFEDGYEGGLTYATPLPIGIDRKSHRVQCQAHFRFKTPVRQRGEAVVEHFYQVL